MNPMARLTICCTSARRRVNLRPLREGQDASGDPPTQGRDEDEKRERRVKTNTLEDLPARKDNEQRDNNVIQQAVISQFALLSRLATIGVQIVRLTSLTPTVDGHNQTLNTRFGG
jgi:hypothetical protein